MHFKTCTVPVPLLLLVNLLCLETQLGQAALPLLVHHDHPWHPCPHPHLEGQEVQGPQQVRGHLQQLPFQVFQALLEYLVPPSGQDFQDFQEFQLDPINKC